MSDYREPPPIDEAKVLQGLIKEVETKADKYALMKAEQDALKARIERSFKDKDIGVPKADPVAVAPWAKQMVRLEQELQNADARIRELEAERDAALAELAKQTDLAREAELKWGNLKDRLRRVEQEQNVEAIKSERNAALARVADLKYFLDKANKLLEQAEAERDKEIQRASDTGAELSQQWANRAKAERERDAARAEAVTLRLALEQTLDWFTTENVGMFEAVYGELDETDVIDHAKKCLSDESIVFRHLDRDRKRDEALAYYADVANYIPTLSQVGLIGKSKVALDGGQRARESLKEE